VCHSRFSSSEKFNIIRIPSYFEVQLCTASTMPEANIRVDGLVKQDLKAVQKAAMTEPKDAMILIGPPGCGKGTVSDWLQKEYNFAHFATGDLLRKCIREKTAVGLKVEAIMKNGQLVDDNTVTEVLRESIQSTPCSWLVLDGYPRTVSQAKELVKLCAEMSITIRGIVEISCPEDAIITRICGRRVHPASGRSYHVTFNPPKKENMDDITGEPLEQRPDDNKEAVQKRLAEFSKGTAPVIAYFKVNFSSIMHSVDGSVKPTEVVQQISKTFGSTLSSSTNGSK